MPVITLTTDWKNNDYYAGAIKGRILSHIPNAVITDVNHAIREHDISNAAFVLRNSFSFFPEGSFHIVSIQRNSNRRERDLLIKADGHFFIGSDTGLFSLMGFKDVEFVYELGIANETPSFPELGIYAECVIRLLKGTAPDNFATKLETFKELIPLRPTIEPYGLDGHVSYVDSFGNTITNISKEMFSKTFDGKKFIIYLGTFHHKIEQIHTDYSEVEGGEFFALFNSVGLLEIGMKYGNISEILKLKAGDNIRVKLVREKPQAKPVGSLF